jgi:phosphomannomutase/phosphoglucomutase
MIGELPPGPEEVQRLGRQAEQPEQAAAGPAADSPRSLDISFDYVAWLQETWADSLRAARHVVLDPMHGCWAARARRYLTAIFPECLFSAIHDWRDPEFDGQSPDCSHPDRLHELCEAVYHHHADVGIAFDGDGDRMALVDNTGIALTAEETTWVLSQSLG